MNIGTIIGLVTTFIILILLFLFSVVAWELYRRDFRYTLGARARLPFSALVSCEFIGKSTHNKFI